MKFPLRHRLSGADKDTLLLEQVALIERMAACDVIAAKVCFQETTKPTPTAGLRRNPAVDEWSSWGKIIEMRPY